MIEQGTVDMIKAAIIQGKSEVELRNSLLDAGYTKQEIAEIFLTLNMQGVAPSAAPAAAAQPAAELHPVDNPVTQAAYAPTGHHLHITKKIISFFVIFMAAAAIGAVYFFFVGGASVKDCGTSTASNDTAMACFQDALKNCEPAKVVMQQTQTGMDVKAYAEVRGGTNTSCSFYTRIDDVTVDSTSPYATMVTAMAALIKGKEMTCTGIDVSRFSISGGIPSMDMTKCTGSLVDAMESFSSGIGGFS